MMGESRSEEKSKFVLSPVHENHESIAKRAHMDSRGTRRLFSPSIENAVTSNEDYDSDEPNKNQSTLMSDRNTGILFSPTSNLPNFVLDGTAPHLLQISPQKHKENVDWLTKIRKERYEQKTDKITSERPCSPKTQATPARRSSRSRSHEPQKMTKATKSSVISLLDFFKAAGKNCEKNPSEDTIVPSTSMSKDK